MQFLNITAPLQNRYFLKIFISPFVVLSYSMTSDPYHYSRKPLTNRSEALVVYIT